MSKNSFKTSDLSIAAFVMMRGLKLLSASRGDRGQFVFVFDDPGNLGTGFAVEFANSECAVYDNHVRNLKKLLYKN
tara:strand:+ start:180 stop:407 length:228 start_codon:yes stop_codon:yes gene_type:complete